MKIVFFSIQCNDLFKKLRTQNLHWVWDLTLSFCSNSSVFFYSTTTHHLKTSRPLYFFYMYSSTFLLKSNIHIYYKQKHGPMGRVLKSSFFISSGTDLAFRFAFRSYHVGVCI